MHEAANSTSVVMDTAIELAEAGWPIVLCGGDTGKKPIGDDWRNIKWDADSITQAFASGDAFNVGMCLGVCGIIDIEADSPEQEAVVLELFGDDIPVTPTYQSIRGKHRLFAWHPSFDEIAKIERRDSETGNIRYGVGSYDTKGSNGVKLGIRLGAGDYAAQSVIPPSNGRKWLVSLDDCKPAAIPDRVAQRIVDEVRRKFGNNLAKLTTSTTKEKPNGGISSKGKAYGTVKRAVIAMSRMDITDGQDGSRRLFACACRCVEHDLDNQQALQAIRLYAEDHPFPRHWSDAEILQRVRDAESTTERGKALLFKLTDMGNAERFVHQHGVFVRYVHAWEKWLVWDGARWRIDDSGEVERLAKQTARTIWKEAAYAANEDELKEITKHARKSESRDRIAAMLSLAKSEPGIPISHHELDANAWLLNCKNGTLNLRTGELRKHDPAEFLTKLAPVEYPDEPGVDCPMWLEFLDTIFDGNQELIGYVQRSLGLSLVGNVFEHSLPIWFGCGANGKSVMIETWCRVLGGDYAMKAPANLLMARKNEQHPTERADLFGKRFVAAVEAEENGRLNESLIKELTGGDTIRARRMREDFWEFKPSHSIVLVTNHKPIVRGTDNGIWRRLRLIPFSVTIPPSQQDKQLTEKLHAEAGAILRWAVTGCIEWQRSGLAEPSVVLNATNEYRATEDILHEFLDEHCVLGDGFAVKAGELYATYSKWCDDRRERPIGQRKFGERLTERGVERFRNNGIWYRGIGLLATNEIAAMTSNGTNGTNGT